MVPNTTTANSPFLVYPDSDGKPMADNTKQLRWIVVLFGNLCALFRDVADVFIAADLLWYPVEGQPELRLAPDVLVVFGRPKRDRGSYQQWLEDNIPLTVVFEILSPGNTYQEMIDKLLFYEEHGVEEYYVYNPSSNRLEVYLRRQDQLLPHRFGKDFVSPRLKVRFEVSGPELVLSYPDGRRFLSFEELAAAHGLAEQRAGKAERRARRLAELARAALRGGLSPEELAELEQLERELSS